MIPHSSWSKLTINIHYPLCMSSLYKFCPVWKHPHREEKSLLREAQLLNVRNNTCGQPYRVLTFGLLSLSCLIMAVTSFTLHLGISGDPCGLVLPSWVGTAWFLWVIWDNQSLPVIICNLCTGAGLLMCARRVGGSWVLLMTSSSCICRRKHSRGSRDNQLAAFEHIKDFQDVPLNIPNSKQGSRYLIKAKIPFGPSEGLLCHKRWIARTLGNKTICSHGCPLLCCRLLSNQLSFCVWRCYGYSALMTKTPWQMLWISTASAFRPSSGWHGYHSSWPV